MVITKVKYYYVINKNTLSNIKNQQRKFNYLLIETMILEKLYI